MSNLSDESLSQTYSQLLPLMSTFYENKVIALTGGTGCVGQGIIEKLLRDCPKIQHIYLLIRNKKNVAPDERMKKLFQLPVFDELRKINGKFYEKISCIPCDLQEQNLGLSTQSNDLLINKVDVFIHCAASIKFNQQLRSAYLINVQCVEFIISLCKKMKNLKSFVHVSTAYSHCNRNYIEERYYECSTSYKDIRVLLDSKSDEEIEKITEKLLDGRPNTYTFTKALAEEVVVEEAGDLPVCVVRPSMIIPASREPIPGWCTNVYGPTAFMIGYAKGLTKSVLADGDVIADLIPIDLVVNAIICAAVKTAFSHSVSCTELSPQTSWININNENERSIKFYNLTTSTSNPLTINKLGICHPHSQTNSVFPAISFCKFNTLINWEHQY